MVASIYEQQRANAERRRAIAETLAAQQAGGSRRMEVAPGGLVVPYSLGEAAADLGKAFIVRRARKKAESAEDEASATREADLASAIEQYRGAVPDENVAGQAYSNMMSAPDGELAAPVYGKTEATNRLMDTVLGPEQSARAMVAQAMTPEEAFTLGKDEVRYQGGRRVAAGPMSQPDSEKLPPGMRMGANGPEWIPGYLEGQERMRGAGASRINIGAQDAARDNQRQLAETGVQDIDRIFALMDDRGPLPDVGAGVFLRNIPNTDASNIDKLLVGIKGGIAVDQLARMRAASPTGGALGNVTERELAMLESLRGSLDQSQSAPQFRDNLARYQNFLLDVIHGPGNGPPRKPLMFQGGGDSGGGMPTFATEQEAEAAAAAGKIKPGQRIKIGNNTGVWQ